MRLRRSPFVLAATTTGLVFVLTYRSHEPTVKVSPANTTIVRNGSREITGAPATTPNGPVQVAVTVRNDHIQSVVPLALPADNAHSVALSDLSGPILVREALAAQGPNIHAVSGATMTSTAFKSSLQSALYQLHAKS